MLLATMVRLFDFNSQPHEEADVTRAVFEEFNLTFQLTASRRG